MITRAMRKSLEAEEGQALVLAAIMLLVISIAVVTTVNIGHNIHERVRMQNNTDAAAYSTAAMEARAFNFYAFANRTQVSHYVSIMAWQSLASFIYWAQAWITDMFGMAKTFSLCDQLSNKIVTKICEQAIKAVPYVGVVISLIAKLVDAFRKFIDKVVAQIFLKIDGKNRKKKSSPDFIIGRVLIPGVQLMNLALAGVQRGLMVALLGRLLPGGKDILEANDKNLPGGAKALNALAGGTLSACMYDRAHYNEANGAPFSPLNPGLTDGLDIKARNADTDSSEARRRTARAKTAMASVANATRHACDQNAGPLCVENFVTDRKISSLLSGVLNLPSFLDPIIGVMDSLIPKRGQTRLLSHRLGRGDEMQTANYKKKENVNNIRNNKGTPSAPIGMNAMGDVLGADDQYKLGIGPDDLGGIGQNPFNCGENDYDGDDKEDDETPSKCWGNPTMDEENANRNLKTSIWAMRKGDFADNGIHHRLAYDGNDPVDKKLGLNRHRKKMGLTKFGICIPATCFKYSTFVANVIADRDGNHPWKGMTPFSHFEPGHYQNDCVQSLVSRNAKPSDERAANFETDWNQPSTFSVIYKGNADLKNPTSDPNATYNTPALITPDGELDLNLFGKSNPLKLDNKGKEFFGLGMMTFSRAQVYYHRPGNWAEHPNFFNPYWKPRLASVYQGIQHFPYGKQFLDAVPGPLKNVPQKILTH